MAPGPTSSKEKIKVPLLAASLHGCCPVRAIGGLLPCGTLFIYSLNWRITSYHGVNDTPGYVYTNAAHDQYAFDPGAQRTLTFNTKGVTPVGQLLLLLKRDALTSPDGHP